MKHIFIIISLLPFVFYACVNEVKKAEIKKDKFSNFRTIKLDTLTIKQVGALLPKNKFVFTNKGIKIFQKKDTAFYAWNMFAIGARYSGRNLIFLQKENYYNIFLIEKGVMFFDACKLSDSISIYSTKNNFLITLFNSSVPKTEIIYIDSSSDFIFYSIQNNFLGKTDSMFCLKNDSIIFYPSNIKGLKY